MRTQRRVLLTYPLTAREMWFGERCLAALRDVADVVLNPSDEVLPPPALAELGRGCEALVLDRLTPVGTELLTRMPQLAAVVRGGFDHRHVDVKAASAAGVMVTVIEPAYQASVAELVLGLILDAARGITHYATMYRRGAIPRPLPGQQVAGATVGIIGYGRIARHLAHILCAMDARVLAFDRAATIEPPVERVELATLVATSDYVVPMIPATPGAPPLLDDALLRTMRPTAWLVNAARGDLVDEDALERLLDAHSIAGAAMDVGWGVDQTPSARLAARADVIATPHVGGITRQSFESHALQAVAQVEALFAGRVPAGALNASDATRFVAMREAIQRG